MSLNLINETRMSVAYEHVRVCVRASWAYDVYMSVHVSVHMRACVCVCVRESPCVSARVHACICYTDFFR